MSERERLLPGLKNRILQVLARIAPGATTTRVRLNRWRGVKIGKDVWIGYDSIIETGCPHLVTIGDRVRLGIRTTITAVNREQRGVTIEDNVAIGACSVLLPNVTIGRGAVVAAGSVVTKSVPAMTMVQGNPAQPIARIGVPFGQAESLKHFLRGLSTSQFLKEHRKVQELEKDLRATITQQQEEIKALTASLKEQDSKIQAVNERLERMTPLQVVDNK
jgi:serine acetyltransferase